VSAEPRQAAAGVERAYADALLDWLACAAAGRGEPAARAARGAGDPLLAAGAAGHVLDFDDTYLPGLAHLSAPTAPVALVLGAELGASVGDALEAYAAGFEAMGGLSAASHPGLYERGFHPTAVCGAAGAAVTAARLLGLDEEREQSAVAATLIGAGGLRAAFGSDGKALQVGMAAAGGARAARLAAAGASVPLERVARGPAGFEAAFGGSFPELAPAGSPGPPGPAVAENWIKAYPCCLQTHGAIEVAERARGIDPEEGIAVVVHPISLQAAPYAEPADGLQAKFSIPYTVAYTLLHGPPGLDGFGSVDSEALALAARRVEVRTDSSLLESEARLEAGGREVGRVEAALGSPARPMTPEQLAAKVRSLAGGRLDGALEDPSLPAGELIAAAGLA
jgi:2-methylcitrate dehydratase PrpD